MFSLSTIEAAWNSNRLLPNEKEPEMHGKQCQLQRQRKFLFIACERNIRNRLLLVRCAKPVDIVYNDRHALPRDRRLNLAYEQPNKIIVINTE